MRLEGRISVVTGGGRGIGRAICLALAREGSDLVIASDVKSEVEKVATEVTGIGRDALPYQLDITKPDQVEALAEATVERFRKLDVLVNNAGVVGKRAFISQSDDYVWRRTIEVNRSRERAGSSTSPPSRASRPARRTRRTAHRSTPSSASRERSPLRWGFSAWRGSR
jgi:NAD(P)-dependent dehydrogenase (short-subunit alcohol dehydrogenase family)